MKESIKFSFIIPVYNAEKYVQECIKSILGQIYRNYEIIIVDDGSEDSSVKKIEEVIQGKKNCILVKNEHGGVSKARNTGLLQATGEYVCFVDADDMIFEDYLQKLFLAAVRYDSDVIYFYAKYGIDTQSRKVEENKILRLGKKELQILSVATLYHIPEIYDRTSSLYNINSFSSWGQVYKREIYKDNQIVFAEGVTLSEDGLANLQLLYYANKGAVICQQLYNYRINNNSVTRSFKPDLAEMFERRDRKVKAIIENLYAGSELYKKQYYKSLIYQIRVISENSIFHSQNPTSRKEKANMFMELINKPDYAEAIKSCEEEYLLKEDRVFLNLAKCKKVGRIMNYIKLEKNKQVIKQRLKKILHITELYRK